MDRKTPETCESVALGVLIYEFSVNDKTDSETKIKRRLKRKKLGLVDPERVRLSRRLKDELQGEIYQFENSNYYLHRHDQYCAMRDFDVLRLTKDLITRYPTISAGEIGRFVPSCVFNYYLR